MVSLFTSELKEGMITLSDTYSNTGRLIIPKDTVITKGIINLLINNDVLFIDAMEPPKELDIPSGTINEEQIVNTPEYKKFKRRYDNHVEDISEHLSDIVNKNARIDVDAILKDTSLILKSTDSPLSVFTMLSTMRNYDDSTFNHSLNVSLICNIFATWLNLSADDIQLITICGLLHDIGKLLMPEQILKKPGKLTNEEYAIIQSHTTKGYEILKKQKVDLHVQYAALMHHEKCDGSGYPLKLKGEQIDWYSQIVTIVDIYEAMTANRVYRKPLSPFTVINMFEEDGLKKYNPKFLLTFLEHVVNSYINCKVKLSNGEEGDIVYINKVRLSKPMVKTKNDFIDLSKKPDLNIESIL